MRGIYGIVDVTDPALAVVRAEALLSAGIRILQLRAKACSARTFLDLALSLRARTRECGASFVINDRPDIALFVEADAVHLGQDDLLPRLVRPWLPTSIQIGVSCHSIAQATEALAVADYIGYGPIFETRSKADPDPIVGLDGLSRVRSLHPRANIVAIGGIDLERVDSIKRAGADAAAMISALTDREAAARAVAAWESA